MVNTNGSPVTGPVNLKVELAYSGPPITVKCSQDFTGVSLTNGVFHLKVDFDCTPNSLTDVLAAIPSGQAASIRVTDVSHSKVYSYQALHAVPFANVASQLVQMNAGDGDVLMWNEATKKWKATTPAASSGGTVTNVSVGAPLTISNPMTTPSITLPQATGAQSGYLSSADWTTFNNKEGTIAGGTAAQFYRGDKSWQTLDTSAVPENVNLYFTNARVLGLPLTGFAPSAGAIVATDTVVEGFSKAQGQINTLSSDSTHFLKKDNTDSITGTVNVGVTGSLTITNAPALPTDVANRQYVNTYADTKLALTGGTLSGALNLDSDLKVKGGSNYVTVRGHATSAAYNFVLPQTAGTGGQFLQTDGSGNLSWVAQSSTATPSGAAGGDLAGTYPNPTVPGLANKISTTLTSGNILVGNGSNVATGVAVSGDATLSNTGVLTLANTAVTAGTYKSVTVDAKGRVTAGTNPTTLAGYGITDTLLTGVSVTAPITNTGTATVPLIGMPVATGSANGYLSSSDFTTFNNKQDAINAATTLNIGTLFSNLQAGLVLNPHSAAAGGTGELRFKELAAGGSNYTGFKAPDALAGNVIYTLPAADGSNGQALTTNSTGGLSWTTVATSSSNLTGDIGGTIGANTIGAGKVTLTHLSATGTKDATTYLRGDNTFSSLATDVRAVTLTGLSTATNAVITAADSVLSSLGKLQKQISDFAVSAVGGDLSGNLPNPTVVKIQGRAVTNTAPLAGQVLKYNTGTPAWEPSYVLVGDLKSSALGNLFPGTGCAANQTLYYSVVGDAFTCVNIDSLDASKITTGTIAAARLPSSATYWQAATGGINYAGGNVGVGTATPSSNLHVAINETGGLRISDTQAAGSGITIGDGTSTANLFHPIFQGTAVGSNRFTLFIGEAKVADDTGTSPVTAFISRRDDSSSIVNRPLFDWRNANTSLMTMNASGNVGIGTTTPSNAARLDVAGSIISTNNTLSTFNANNGGFDFLPSNKEMRIFGTSTDTTGGYVTITTGQNGSYAERLRVTQSGNVGIGTNAPTVKLQIGDATVDTNNILKFGKTVSTTQSTLPYISQVSEQSAGVTNDLMLFAGGTGGGRVLVNSNDFVVKTGGGTTPSGVERLRIDSSGNVGIGTTDPQFSLDVSGASAGKQISNTFYGTASSPLFVGRRARGTEASPTAVIVNDSLVTFGARAHDGTGFVTGSSKGYLTIEAAENWSTTNNGTNVKIGTTAIGSTVSTARLTVNSEGNVGIGTTTPSQKLDVVGNIQSADTFYTSVTFADGWAVGDYKELVVAGGVGGAGSSGLYNVALSATRGNWTEATTFTTLTSHSDGDFWREVPAKVVNYYTTYAYRCFTVDANTSAQAIKFRVRAIRPSTDCSASSTGSLPIYFKFSSEGYNSGWTALTATGTGATVSGYRTTNGSEWNLYTGASRNAGLPTITAKEGSVGIGTNNPSYKLDVRGRIMSVNPAGLTSGGDYIGFATETGDLPGYPASAYSVIKTNSQYVYFSINGSYSSYISAGGAYTAVSDRNKKENFVELDYDDIRKRIDELPITKWNYKAEDKSIKHIGPMAQDFHRLFGLNGSSDKMIAQMDTTGVALVGVKSISNGLRKIENFIKEFYSEFTSSKKAIADQQAKINALEKKNAELEARLRKIEESLNRKPASK